MLYVVSVYLKGYQQHGKRNAEKNIRGYYFVSLLATLRALLLLDPAAVALEIVTRTSALSKSGRHAMVLDRRSRYQ